MRKIKMYTTMATLSLAFTCPAPGQIHDRFESVCPALQNAIAPDLLQYLNGVTPDEKNAWCVTRAIHKLGDERYEPAIPVLVRLLDFRRPLDEREKKGFYLRMQGIWEIYPAAGALSSMGQKAVPFALEVIKSESASSTARENAVFVFMEIHRFGDQHPKGVALLKQEETNARDEATKQRLKWAVQKALTWCNDEAACKEAAR